MQTTTITRLTADEGKYLRKDNQFYKTVDLKDGESSSDYEEVAEKVMKKYYAQMTPREFVLGMLSRGVTREQIEELIANNQQVWAELNYATYIERKNPLLDELCGQFGLTPEDVDGIFGLN
jgi:hypothetical protein